MNGPFPVTRFMRSASTLCFAFWLSVLAGAKTYRLSPTDNWFDLLHGNGLSPGDEVILEAGTYSNERRLELSHVGTKQKPIVIRAANQARVLFRRPDARQNTFNLAGTQYLTIRGLEITGARPAFESTNRATDWPSSLPWRHCTSITLEARP